MPVKDTAREAAFAAMRAARPEIVRICREIHDNPAPKDDEQRVAERLSALLADNGFEIETGIAGLPSAFRATRRNHDTEAMRKGLRHAELAILVPASDSAIGVDIKATTGLAAALCAAIGLGGSLAEEYGTVSVIGYPDETALVAMARAEVFDEFDAVVGARQAAPGDGYCYTIDGTGETLSTRSATLTVDGDITPLAKAIDAEASALNAPDRIEVVAQPDGVMHLALTGRSSVDVREFSVRVQRLVDETPGAQVAFGEPVDDTIVSRILARRVKTYADTLGYKMDKIRKTEPAAPSGWGNVSQVSPTFVLNFPGADHGVDSASGDEYFDRAFRFAECLCLAGVDVVRDMQFRSIADDQLVRALANRGIHRQHRRWLGVHPVINDPAAKGKNGKKGPKLADFRMVRGPGMRDN